ncbi:MAG TPA: DUF4097 family beta strand repeat-containing protein [Vicinamibacteria bacterium]
MTTRTATATAVRSAVGAGLGLALALGAGAQDFKWSGRLAAGQTLEIKGVNGSIVAEGGSGEAEVTAVKSARKSDPAGVEVKVIEHSGGITICALYPSPSFGRSNSCAPGDEGHMSTRDNDVKVDFTVRVPAGVRFAGRTVNGKVEANDLPADAEAETVNGGIELTAAGNVRAETVNGSIRARGGRSDWKGTVDFETVNGSITVELPADTNLEFDAETVNGSIETDFALSSQGRRTRRHLSGTIGNGGRRMQLETVNGSIAIRKGQ